MTIQCNCCGSVSDLEESFIKSRKSFGLHKYIYCPQCWSERELESHKSCFWFLGFLFLFILILWFFDKNRSAELLKFFLFAAFLTISIAPHELGHAMMARCLGMRVFMIIMGSGQTLKKLHFLGFDWEFKQFPLYGITLYSAKEERFFRLKRFLITLSGPAANIGLLLVALYSYKASRVFESWSLPFAPFACFAFANVWLVLFNLVPHKYKTAYGKLPSDGLSLLKIPFTSKKEIHHSIVFYYAMKGLELRKNGQLSEALQWYQKSLSIYPNDNVLSNDYALVLMDSEKFEEAKTIYRRILENQKLNAELKSIILNNLSFTDILIGDSASLREADLASAQAFSSCPWIPAIKGTRGMVLVELGKLDEGIQLLKEALQRTEELHSKALNAAYIAIAESRKGNRLDAEQYLKVATQLDSNSKVLKRAQNEIYGSFCPHFG